MRLEDKICDKNRLD